MSQSDVTHLVNSSVAAGISAFQQAQASSQPPPTATPPTIAGVSALDSVDVVGLKLGTFWTDRPAVWFAQAEAQFLIKKITVETTMFHHVLVALDNRTSGEVEHLIVDPPADKPYTALKEALLEAYEKTPAQKDREFMAIRSLGDLTPSAMLRKMRRLRPKMEHSSTLFRWSYLRVLPLEVSNILIVMEEEPLEVLAKKADRILEQKIDAPGSVAAISNSPSTSNVFTVGEVDALRQVIRGNAPRGNKTPTPSTGGYICNGHSRWGSRSFSCKPGCIFADSPLAKRSGNGNAGR